MDNPRKAAEKQEVFLWISERKSRGKLIIIPQFIHILHRKDRPDGQACGKDVLLRETCEIIHRYYDKKRGKSQ